MLTLLVCTLAGVLDSTASLMIKLTLLNIIIETKTNGEKMKLIKPVIGISGSILVNKGDSFVGYKRVYANQDYVNSVLRAGGIPLILPFTEDVAAAAEMVRLIDGLILSGGHDVDPSLYGEEPLLKLGETFPQRDVFDEALYKKAIALRKPVLGVCRGLQLINVMNGGSLYQDLSYANFIKIKHDQDDGPCRLTHTITIEDDSFIKTAETPYRVNSFHHQCIKKIAEGFTVAAKSLDGVVEAIQKITADVFVVAVQWHPEMLSATNANARNIFEEFIKAVSKMK
ncbi:Protein NtpR [Treponema phagedenis]|uniref:gamma-glutamyl-gamma-aminobutyrate hydrolase n=1 Tax=Treponema phagedenis TaxID=162 RepID=A0A0B7H0V9_TREPH|nr:gamma-glutamyl-gamma-aminobutyrate hydrolase family protein [Treponema phagedenis]CEM62546.1 Protein NtpR [Treponema phagedenis]